MEVHLILTFPYPLLTGGVGSSAVNTQVNIRICVNLPIHLQPS